MVAGRTHFHCPSSVGRGTIVVDDTPVPAAELALKKVPLLLDYLKEWDYIGIRFDSCAAVRAVEPAAGSRSTAANLKKKARVSLWLAKSHYPHLH